MSSNSDQGNRSSEEKAFNVPASGTTDGETGSTTLADESMKTTFPKNAFWDASTLPSPSAIAAGNITPEDLAAWQAGISKPILDNTVHQKILQYAGQKLYCDDKTDLLGIPRVNLGARHHSISHTQTQVGKSSKVKRILKFFKSPKSSLKLKRKTSEDVPPKKKYKVDKSLADSKLNLEKTNEAIEISPSLEPMESNIETWSDPEKKRPNKSRSRSRSRDKPPEKSNNQR